MSNRKTPITEFFNSHPEGPEGAEKELFGREIDKGKRGFLRGAGLATMTALIGGAIPFSKYMPAGFIPEALADADVINGKDGLIVLNDRPVNAEAKVHLLNDDITPTKRHFIRNNGIPPMEVDANSWTLTIDGFVDNPMTLTIADLKKKFKVVTKAIVLECGGNGRSFFNPPAKGNQWTYGAVACSNWTGVRLKDVLKAAGVKKEAVYTAHIGADMHLSMKEGKLPISRGMPIKKALTDENILIAFEQNGEAIHPMNGAPLRLIVPGMPASVSHKWLNRIWIRDQIHDGPKMTGTAYRVPKNNVSPGTKVPTEDFEIIERMPVKSLITSPQTGTKIKDKSLKIRGHAWAGERSVKSVELSKDFGATWQKASLTKAVNKDAWQHFEATLDFPESGYYEIWAKATDSEGISQPFAINWNPKGYLNNSFHRISVTVT